jgi:site-specific recombinase XerD
MTEALGSAKPSTVRMGGHHRPCRKSDALARRVTLRSMGIHQERPREGDTGRRPGTKLDADLLSAADIELLMRGCSRRAPTGIRNRALIAVLWRCGLRIGEARGLAVKDFDPDSGTLVVQRGKGGKRRVVGVDAGTVALVSRWLEVRQKRGIPGGGPLFCSLAGGPLDLSYVRHLMPRLARKAGIERRVHAHGLRHAFAVDLVRSGAPFYVVRDALGHASVATTQVYLSRVGAHEAVEAMRNRHWSPE